MHATYDVNRPAKMISGISMRSSSPSAAGNTGCGGRSTRTVMSSIKSSRPGANTKTAKRLLTRLLKKQGLALKRMITDKLGSYAAARRQIMPTVEHRSHKGLNNWAEIPICQYGNESGQCRGSDPRETFNASFQSSPQFATSSFLLSHSFFSPPSSPESNGALESHDRYARLNLSAKAGQTSNALT